jgi:hypothetical protein
VIIGSGAGGPTWQGALFSHHGNERHFARWFQKLQVVAQLSDGWDSYKAPAPAATAVAAARQYLGILALLNREPTRVAASAMGGVGITHRQGSRKVYVEFYNNGTAHALFSDRDSREMRTAQVGTDLTSYYRLISKARAYLDV